MHRISLLGVLSAAVLVSACTSSNVKTTTTITPDPAPATTFVPPRSTTSGDETTTTAQKATTTTLPLSELTITLTEVGSGFDFPVLLVADPEGGPDFVVEQPGRIVRADGDGHAVALDIRGDVRFGGEQGLLGLAFHPDFATNRLAYVNYIDGRDRTTIRQFEVHDGVFDTESGRSVLVIDQPAGNHNGGMIAFGPRGHLWIGMGDGGAADDAFGNGQDSHSLLGSMLRISVPGTGQNPYDIPELNPFADGVDGAPEVYWTGLRNPWRFSLDFFEDGVGANVWVADVGQKEVEEVSVVHTDKRRANFGWPIMEGSECFQSESCDQSGLIVPIIEYGHDKGCSVTGGHVYRGRAMPELSNQYFYSDFCSGFLRSYSVESGNLDWTDMTGSTPQVSGFGVGGDGEMYVVSLAGFIYRIERAE